MERRAGTKGNADQQSTCRAQSRVSVSQALDRIRKVAKERKKERLTALFHHISIDLLEEAFFELKEDAAPDLWLPGNPAGCYSPCRSRVHLGDVGLDVARKTRLG